jgi:hypothetical protein
MRAACEINLAASAIVPTRQSRRQLRTITRRRGGPSMFVLQSELARYVFFHQRAGRMDDGGQALRFDEGISLLVGKLDGVWHILRIWRREGREIYRPVFVWRAVRRGWRTRLARALIGWRCSVLLPGRAAKSPDPRMRERAQS